MIQDSSMEETGNIICYVGEFASKNDERILGCLMVTLFATTLLKMTDSTMGLGRILHWIVVFCYWY